ncbi:hypothetical protein I4U23_019976 [Adineta vaga]|nr:hypothetical protein I4U23_019976 [Adineta vaga]
MDQVKEQPSVDSSGDEKPFQPQSEHLSDDASTVSLALCDPPQEIFSLSILTPNENIDATEQTPVIQSDAVIVSPTVVPPPTVNQSNSVSESTNVVEPSTRNLIHKSKVPLPLPEIAKSESNILHESVKKKLEQSAQSNVEYDLISKYEDQIRATKSFLGRGYYGSVISVKIAELDETRIAVKCVTFKTEKQHLLSIRAELTTLEMIRSNPSQFLVNYFCTIQDKMTSELYFCMELMDASTEAFYKMMHSMEKDAHDKHELFVRRCAYNVIMGLQFLKTKNIVHRDVKPANILINQKAMIKLADFGISGNLDDKEYDFSIIVRTDMYRQPNPDRCSIQRDMWALGISLLEIILNQHPICISPQCLADTKIEEWKPEVSTKVSPDLENLILQLLEKDPKRQYQSYDAIIRTTFIGEMSPDPSPEEIVFVQHILKQIALS